MHKFILHIGLGFDREDKPIDEATAMKAMAETCAYLTDSFGGYTVTAGTGGWLDADNKLVQEKVVSITVFFDSHTDPFTFGVKAAFRVGTYWKQKSVLLEYNNKGSYVNLTYDNVSPLTEVEV